MKIIQNESPVDRIIRLVVGILAGYSGFFYATGIVRIVLYVVAVAGLFTAITGWCKLYDILGINTKKKK
jgi:hypothetical protein